MSNEGNSHAPAARAPHALLFDLDETLLADGADTWSALLTTSAWIAQRYPVDAAQLAQATWQSARHLWAQSPERAYSETIGISAGEGLWGHFTGNDAHLQALAKWAPTYQREAWARGLESLSVTVAEPELVEELAERFHVERRAHHTLFPDAEPALRALRLSGAYRLALVTNGAPDIQRSKIMGAGIAHLFDVIVVSGELGVGKPALQIFTRTLNALEALGANISDAIMVGDNRVNDVWGAQQAGVRGVWLRREGESPESMPAPDDGIIPDMTLTSLSNVDTALV